MQQRTPGLVANRHFYLLCLLDLGHPRKYIYICTERFSLVARGSGEGDLQPLQLSHPHSRSVLQPFPMEDCHQALSPGSLSIWFHCSIFIFWHKIQDTFRSLLLTGKNPMNKLMLILCDQPWRGAEEESQHHRITQVRRTHSKVSGPASCPKQGQLQHQTRLLRAFSKWVLKPATDRASTSCSPSRHTQAYCPEAVCSQHHL